MLLNSKDIEPNFRYSQLTSEDIRQSQNTKMHVVYDLIDLNQSDYNFSQIFEGCEANQYFKCMHFFSTKTINEIVDDSDKQKDFHFYTSKIAGCLKNALEKAGFNFNNYDEPLVYHFALDHTKKETACRVKNIRNPRLYFIVGAKGAIHPLFFDPFHELNPISNNSYQEEKKRKKDKYEKRIKRINKEKKH